MSSGGLRSVVIYNRLERERERDRQTNYVINQEFG